MTTVEDTIKIEAPITVVFDAERDIGLHAVTQSHRGERAVGGVTTGLIELDQEVEWEARHFGISQRLRVKITEMNRPTYFRDEMVHGVFKSFSHEHHFNETAPNQTEKRDVISFQAPFGVLGRLAEAVFLRTYMLRFLREKNKDLKRLIESRGEQIAGGDSAARNATA